MAVFFTLDHLISHTHPPAFVKPRGPKHSHMDPTWKKDMQEFAEKQVAAGKLQTLTVEKYEKIKQYLENTRGEEAAKIDPYFKHWVKKKGFQLIDIPALGVSGAIVTSRKGGSGGEPKCLRVVSTDMIVDVLYDIHTDKLKHAGYKKVLEIAKGMYYGITRGFVQEFCKKCPTCSLRAPKILQPPLRPIVMEDFLKRIQVDLVDMRHAPDGEYKYIGHFIDHFTKFNVLFPLKTKAKDEVAVMLEERVLAYVGPPRIFHSDNGREFVNELLQELLKVTGSKKSRISSSSAIDRLYVANLSKNERHSRAQPFCFREK